MCSPRMRVITILTVSTKEGSVSTNRGERWRCFGESYIHGCDGLWHGVLLSSDHFPSVQSPRSQTGLRCACTGCPNHGRSAHHRLSIQMADALQLALTAASPLWRGYIADVDCRWNVIAGSVDDRTEEERGLKVWCGDLQPDQLLMVPQPLKSSRFVIPKSRYGSIDSYISEDPRNRPEYNDNAFPHDKGVYNRLKTHGSLYCIQGRRRGTNEF